MKRNAKMEIQILNTIEQKRQTIPLYQEAFGDPEIFVTYYYNEKCKDNFIFVKKQEEQIVSMLHLNPYQMIVNGNEYSTFYVVAVATKNEFRHQGHMRDLLNAAFDWMGKRRIPFCFLMPVNKAIYEPFGFEKICNFDWNSERSEEEIQENFTVYCKRDSVYRSRLTQEKQIAAVLEESGLPNNPIIMAAVTNEQEFLKMMNHSLSDREEKNQKDSRMAPITNTEMLEWLRQQKIYICEEV